MILMPGFDGTGELFSPLIAALSPHHRPTVIRYRDERTFEDYMDTASAALPDEGAILIAESFSGPIALGLMARHPGRIRSAVLCATFVKSPFHTLTQLARFVPTPLFGLRLGQRAMLQQFCVDDRCDPALMNQALAVIKSMPAAAVAARLNVLAHLRVRALCRNIRTPILILRATGDRLVSPSRYKQLIDELPGAIVKDVEGPHLLLQSRPQECARLIDEFVSARIR
jgi:pimeloyl-[acyl-carrier protein] methyl ester esterase